MQALAFKNANNTTAPVSPDNPAPVTTTPQTATFGAAVTIDVLDEDTYQFTSNQLPADFPFVLIQVQERDARINYACQPLGGGELVPVGSSGRFTRAQVLAMRFFVDDDTVPAKVWAQPYKLS
jgi:hypothetical protein